MQLATVEGVPPVPPVRTQGGGGARPVWLWVAIAVAAVGVLACIVGCVIFVLIPRAEGTPTPDPRGELLYEEDFSSPGDEWLIEASEDTEYRLDNGAYSIAVWGPNWMAWENTDGDYADFVLEFDATLVEEGDSYNAYGCLFRYVGKNTHYELDVNGNGSYSIGKDIEDEWTQLVDWTYSSAIKTWGETNHFRLIGQGDTFTLYINDQYVDEFTDASLSRGDVAMVVTAYDTPPARATFDNIRVWALGAR